MSDTSKQNDEDDRDPATRAFDALRDELARVRQSMEDLRAGIQQSRPHDYRRTLGEILRAQQNVDVELQAIKSHPAINLTPDRFVHQLEEARNEMIKADQRKLKIIMNALEHNCITIKDYFETANEASRQKIMVISAGIICFCIGTFLSVTTISAIANMLPTSWQAPELIASNILGATMREAGARLIRTDNPERWNMLLEDNRIMNENREPISKCLNDAIETKRGIKCTILLKCPP
jgi:hypothetical protein